MKQKVKLNLYLTLVKFVFLKSQNMLKSSTMVIHLLSYSFSFWSVFNGLHHIFLLTEDLVSVGLEDKMIFPGGLALDW